MEETRNITDSTDPLTFTGFTQEVEQDVSTRASGAVLLSSDFMVSTYKAFALGTQQQVMDKYRVEYKTSGNAWDGTIRPYWDYTTVDGQYERFWDYSNYPYRFHALAPCPASPASVVLNDKQLTINTPYKMQSCINGTIIPNNAQAEPFLVSQVQRNVDGKDFDFMATTSGGREINTNGNTRNRSVAMPFHHLNSKIRFGIYATAPWATDNRLYIKDLVVDVTSAGFATSAVGYNAISTEGNFSWYRGTHHSGFTGVSQASAVGTRLLQFDGGKDIEGNELSLHQGTTSAYWLRCPDGIMQIPQEGVQMNVSFKLYLSDGSLYQEFKNVPIKVTPEDAPPVDSFDWQSGYLYTYYLIIGGIEEKLEITFTCTLTPWEDVSGSLSTDLEK